MIVCDDVLHWAETYRGEPFHALIADAPYHMTESPNKRLGSRRAMEPRTDAEKHARKTAQRGFMGSRWDGTDADGLGIAFRPDTWRVLAQHLLPGAFGLAFGSARGWHRLACAIEDAGLILHPSVFMLGWAYGSGWPKATRIDTAVDKAAGAEREYVGEGRWASSSPHPQSNTGRTFADDRYQRPARDPQYAPATDLAKIWAGHRYGRQALKPSLEPIICFQVPYRGRPVDSIVATGAGALWIDGSRINPGMHVRAGGDWRSPSIHAGWQRPSHANSTATPAHTAGRWPPNLALIHDPRCQPLGPRQVPGVKAPGPDLRYSSGYSTASDRQRGKPIQQYAAPDGTETVLAYSCVDECPVKQFDLQAGERASGTHLRDHRGSVNKFMAPRPSVRHDIQSGYDETGPASRFFNTADWSLNVAEQLTSAGAVFYCAKSSPSERDEGLARRPFGAYEAQYRRDHGVVVTGPKADSSWAINTHPTVKPLSLCQWLATLLAPPAAYAPRRLLVPFCGVASEMIAAVLSHQWEEVVGIESDPAYAALGRQRLAYWTTQIAAQLSLFPEGR